MLQLSIDVFSDVVCPWCFIGSVRLEQALEGLSSELTAQVTYRPYFLDPSVPEQGVSVPDKLRKQYGVDPKQLWARAESAARESGLALDLSKQPMMYRTVRAHTLLRHALARGSQRALAGALFRAYFLDARNIADEAVLAEIAEQHGFGRAEALDLMRSPVERESTEREATSAVQRGIRGVPFYIFGGRLAVSGAERVTVLQAAIRKALAQATPEEAPGAG